MLKLKTKWFNKWANKNAIADQVLLETLKNLSDNLNAVNLGAGLYKVRTKKIGKGKSGGYRTLIAYKEADKAIFIYGFSKTEKDNLENDELRSFKKLAKDLLKINKQEFDRQVNLGNFYLLEE
jgi:hypothetical protein